MPEEDFLEVRFRLYDATDIGPFRYSPASTVAVLKERIVAEWPKVVHCLISHPSDEIANTGTLSNH
ncbi:Membrane-anchored ubiquitin-fold protein 4 [Linum perenne]